MTTPSPVRAAFKQALIETIREHKANGVERPDINLVLIEVANMAVMPSAPWDEAPTQEPEEEAA